jgi:peptide/nickel transport system ATP-binding protein
MASNPIIRVEHLKKYFPVTKGLLLMKTIGSVKAVDDISFAVQPGETLA